MKNTSVTIIFEKEKLEALSFHMGKKDVDLQAELNETIQRLYEKHVPQPTREYIEDKIKRENAVREKSQRLVHRPEPPIDSGGI